MKSTVEIAAEIRAERFWLDAPVRGGATPLNAYLDALAEQVETAAPEAAEQALRTAAARFGEGRSTLHGAMVRGWLLAWADQLALPCGGKGHWGTWRSRLSCGHTAFQQPV